MSLRWMSRSLTAVPTALLAWYASSALALNDTLPNEIRECQNYSRRYLPKQPVECGPYSIKVNAPKKASAFKGKLKLGGFNIKHLGTASDAITRDYAAIAEIINQWDVVGILELEDWSNSNLEHNEALDVVLKARPDLSDKILPSYVEPAQITLLKSLQKLDPTWALVMTTTPQGELGNDGTISSAENGLQYYRGSKVSPLPLKYCGGDQGCAQRFAPQDAPLVSRSPLISGYKAGTFRFVLASTHTRFNEPVRPDSMMAFEEGLDRLYRSEVKARVTKMSIAEREALLGPLAQNSSDGGLSTINKLNREELRGVAKKLKIYTDSAKGFRLAETWAVMSGLQWLSNQENLPRVIFQGDFNLEPGDFERFNETFFSEKGSIPGGRVFVSTPTSISTKVMNGQLLASAYDHFVFNPNRVPECNGDRARSFDFTTMPRYVGPDLKIKGKAAMERVLNQLSASFKAINSKELGPRFSKGELLKLQNAFDRGLVNPPPSAENQPIFRLFSDHIPIWMECVI